MKISIAIVLLTGIIPLIIGFVWYNPKLGFGKAWMKASEMTDEKMKGSNMSLIFGLTYVFSFFLAFALVFMTTHQHHVTSLFFKQPIDDASSEMGAIYKAVMDHLGNSYRTFKHGALHGTIGGFMVAFPVITVNALFERKSFKYIAVNAGYWIVCMGIMGGLVCAFA